MNQATFVLKLLELTAKQELQLPQFCRDQLLIKQVRTTEPAL
jgi:hypothetical protein